MSQNNGIYKSAHDRASSVFLHEEMDRCIELRGHEAENLRVLDKAITWLDQRYFYAADRLGEHVQERTLVLLQELALIKHQRTEFIDRFNQILLSMSIARGIVDILA